MKSLACKTSLLLPQTEIFVTEPLFWLGCSLLLVAVSLTALLVVALPTLQEVARAARSAEKLFDTLTQELPATLESLRHTGADLSELTDELAEGVSRAGNVVKQVDQGIQTTRQQVQSASINTRSFLSGVGAAWHVLTQSPSSAQPDPRLAAGTVKTFSHENPVPESHNGLPLSSQPRPESTPEAEATAQPEGHPLASQSEQDPLD